MAGSHWIMPRADAACGKVFHPDRRSADGHRIALEFWDRATGCGRKDSRLAVYRCKRCFGFHIARKWIVHEPVGPDRFPPPYEMSRDWPEPHRVESAP